LKEFDAVQGIKLMVDFYRSTRVEGCDLDADGDMLLFQWSTHESARFIVNITRQLILSQQDDFTDDDGGVWQLSLTFEFEPKFQEIRAGHFWCETTAALAEFEARMKGSQALSSVNGAVPLTVDLTFEDAE
jgi:hypothetical protein